MSENERPLLSTSDELPSQSVLLERLRAENKQPVVLVPACVGCGKIPHGSVNAFIRCLREALIEARSASALTTSERAELVELRMTVERLDRQAANQALQARGRG